MRYRINRIGGREEGFLCVGLGVVLTPMYLQGRWDNQIKSLPRLSTFACQRKTQVIGMTRRIRHGFVNSRGPEEPRNGTSPSPPNELNFTSRRHQHHTQRIKELQC